MKQKLTMVLLAFFATTLIISCGGGKDKKGATGDMKAKLEKLKKEKNKLDADIRKLEADIAKADPDAKKAPKLVAVDTIETKDFVHYIEIQGTINSDAIGYVAPTGQGGLVKAILVKPGQKVSKGQLVAKLDDAIARQGVVAAQQQVATAQQQAGQVKARLDQAQTIYTKYQNLWNQGIGAEIQVINAKADVDALSAQLRAAQAQVGAAQTGVKLAQEQVNMSNVYSGLSGTVEQVNVRVGEFFTGVGPDRKPQIMIVNNTWLKAEVPVPDRYAAHVKKDAKVLVVVPDLDTTFETTINVVGASIDPTTRSFMAETKPIQDAKLKPNLTVTMKILDYESKGAVAVPVNVVQSDEQGKYVYVAEKSGDKTIVRKKVVVVGQAFDGVMEIKSGLSSGEVIITEGFQTVYDGQTIRTNN